MIQAGVRNKFGKAVLIDLTVGRYDLYEELRKVGFYGSPERLYLRGDEEAPFRLQLCSDSRIGNHMLSLFCENDTLYDAYQLVQAVTNVRAEIRTDLEQNILYDRYSRFSEVLDDIQKMRIELAQTKMTFYCPLTVSLDEGEGEDSYIVSNQYIADYRDKIEERLKAEQTSAMGDMAQRLGEHSGFGKQIIYAVWGLEEINGEIYGKIDCYLKEPLDTEEAEKLRWAVSGQNNEVFGNGLERRANETEDGYLFVSFWNNRDDYFLYTESEMRAYLENHNGQQMGGM